MVAQLHLDWSLNPAYSYGWTVPFLAAFLFWLRWNERPPAQPTQSGTLLWTLLISLAAFLLPLRLLAKANPDSRPISWAVGLCLVSGTLIALYLIGARPWLKHFAFPILFCLVSIPWPFQFEQWVVQQLLQIVTAIDVELLTLLGVAAMQHGNVIELARGTLGIEDACSGIRSLQSTFMLSLFMGEFYRLTLGRRLVLVASGAALAFFFNICRTFLLAWVADREGISSIARWHDPAGWAVIICCLVFLWGISWRMSEVPSLASPPPQRTMPRLPTYALLAFGCWLCFVEGSSELWFRERDKNVPSAPPWAVVWPAPGRFEEIPIPQAAVDQLNYNEGRAIAFDDEAGKHWNFFFFKWYPGRTVAPLVKIHRPEICLPASGYVPAAEPRSELVQINGISLPIRAYRFYDGATPVHVYYCYWDGTVFRDAEEMTNDDRSLHGRLRRVWTGRRERGAQTLEIAVWGHHEDAHADADLKQQLARFVRAEG